jgi:hypothetical protein
VLSTVGDLLRDGVDPVERVEFELRGSRARVRGGAEEDEFPLSFLHVALGHGRADQVAGEPLDRRRVVGQDDLFRIDGEAGVHPGEQGVQERLGEPLGLVESQQHEPAEEFLHDGQVHRREWQERAIRRERAVTHQGVNVGMEVGAEGTEGLQ